MEIKYSNNNLQYYTDNYGSYNKNRNGKWVNILDDLLKSNNQSVVNCKNEKEMSVGLQAIRSKIKKSKVSVVAGRINGHQFYICKC